VVASPTLIGAVTTLVIVVAVFLTYNANQGLPFVPAYRVSATVPNAARVIQSNEVRIGGNRVGVVESVEPVRNPENGGVAAKLNLKLDRRVAPIAADTSVRIRYRSSFGLKYVELTRGSEGAPLEEGQSLAIDRAVEQTEFDDIGNTFDEETRVNARRNLVGYGNAFAGRGVSLNETFEALNPLFTALDPVMATLSAPATRLDRFFPELGDAARIVAPVAVEQAELFSNMATTFAAFADDPDKLKETISESPETLEVSARALRNQRPFLTDFADLSRRLQPATKELVVALPTLNDALEVGAPVLRRTPEANRNLGRAFASLEELLERPSTKISFQRLDTLFDEAAPLLDYVVPYQTVCNYWNYQWGTLAGQLDLRDQVGFVHKTIPVTMPSSQGPSGQQGSLGGYSGIQANGRNAVSGEFEPHELAIRHDFPYGPAIDANGNADCQSGQVGYPLGQLLAPGQPASNPSIQVSNIPGNRGPTFTGRPRRP